MFHEPITILRAFLAQRSATAAKEIKQLIDVTVEKAEAGTVLAEHAGVTMREIIIESVHGVSRVMSEIASASREQSSGIAQVNAAVMQMDEVTQQNAALVVEHSQRLNHFYRLILQAARCCLLQSQAPGSGQHFVSRRRNRLLSGSCIHSPMGPINGGCGFSYN